MAHVPLRVQDGHVRASCSQDGSRSPRRSSGSRRCAGRCSSRDDSGARVGSKRSGSPTSLVASAPSLRLDRSPTRRRCPAGAPASDRRARTCCAAPRRTAPGRRATPANRPTSSTPIALSALRSRVVPLRRADELRRGQAARPRQVVDLVVALVPHARRRPSTTGCRARGTCAAAGRARRPTSVTGRPERWISSASCTPVADAPTTSTARPATGPGSR